MNNNISQNLPIVFTADITARSIFALKEKTISALATGQYNGITLLMDSRGGDFAMSMEGANFLRELPISTTAYNMGKVWSSAGLIYFAMANKFATPDSTFLFHPTQPLLKEGNYLLDYASNLTREGNIKLAWILNKATGIKQEIFMSLIQKSACVPAREAFALGLVYGIKQPPEFSKSGSIIMISKEQYSPAY